jgi:hypothetical protein
MDDANELDQPRRAAQAMRDSVGSSRTESASCTPRATAISEPTGEAELKETYLIR